MSRKNCGHTRPKDQLRRLWVDFYIQDVDEESIEAELKSGDLSPRFIKDLAALQMQMLRWEETVCSQPPPYRKDPTAYHRPDRITGVCCCRAQFEGTEHKHRCDYVKEETGPGNSWLKQRE